MKIILANPRGFCAGVDRAVAIVNLALEQFPHPIYVRHEVVHNRYVVEDLKERGAVFVEELDEIPCNSIVIFSAHGVSQSVRAEAKERRLHVFDATCPLVSKVHMQVHRASRRGEFVILIGHSGHPEVIGTMGQYLNHDKGGIVLVESVESVEKLEIDTDLPINFMSQTTLSVDDTRDIITAIQKKFPTAKAPRKSDICYATTNRQDAVRMLVDQVDRLLVIGSSNSSNSTRLAELGNRLGVKSFLIDQVEMINEEMISGAKIIGMTAGASAPEVLVQSIIKRLFTLGVKSVENLEGIEENIIFEVPKELSIKQL